MATVRDVYRQCCDVLLEPLPVGLSTGMFGEADFLGVFENIVQDFHQRTGLFRRLVNIPVVAGQSSYVEPDYLLETQEVAYDGRHIHQETAQSLDFTSRNWRSKTGPPERWHADRLALKTVQVWPTPTANGYSVAVSAPLYGTISATAGATDFDIAVTAPLYGTIASYTSPVYVETIGPLYGTIAAMASSTKNLTLLGPTKQNTKNYTLDSLIDDIPDTFIIYLKYGVLETIFSQDGEMRDPLRARYCGARYEEGVMLATAASTEVTAGVQEYA